MARRKAEAHRAKIAHKKERERLGLISRATARIRLSDMMRVWRESLPGTKRKLVARESGVEKQYICFIEHNHADKVREEDFEALIGALQKIAPLPRSEVDYLISLYKKATEGRRPRTCHRERWAQKQLSRNH